MKCNRLLTNGEYSEKLDDRRDMCREKKEKRLTVPLKNQIKTKLLAIDSMFDTKLNLFSTFVFIFLLPTLVGCCCCCWVMCARVCVCNFLAHFHFTSLLLSLMYIGIYSMFPCQLHILLIDFQIVWYNGNHNIFIGKTETSLYMI